MYVCVRVCVRVCVALDFQKSFDIPILTIQMWEDRF